METARGDVDVIIRVEIAMLEVEAAVGDLEPAPVASDVVEPEAGVDIRVHRGVLNQLQEDGLSSLGELPLDP